MSDTYPPPICEAVNLFTGNRCSRPVGHMGYHMHFDADTLGVEGWGRR